jgi:hypothetical protein
MVAIPRAPGDLEASGKRLWRELHTSYELDPGDLALVHEACRTLDELDRLAGALREMPPVVEGSSGQPRSHPVHDEVRKHRALLADLVTQLAPQEDPPRRRRRRSGS